MKLPRFNSFNNERKRVTPDDEWRQLVTLPMQPNEYEAYRKERDKRRNGDQEQSTNKVVPNNEHILSALGDLLRAIDLDGKILIDYILKNNLVKGGEIDEP